VCLDDFGAGHASLDYLRRLEVDFIKFDGRYIRTLTAGSRDEVILKHMVGLCRELGIETIAEMIETQETAKLAEGIGLGLGQGWFFAKPGVELAYPPPSAALPVRRKGEVVSWG
jgi:EAL domain-containing protein (putative c-di-GMP-specific phosphodiesterase class I)